VTDQHWSGKKRKKKNGVRGYSVVGRGTTLRAGKFGRQGGKPRRPSKGRPEQERCVKERRMSLKWLPQRRKDGGREHIECLETPSLF